ncbi:hypothetical protein KP509_02G085600 [Ceratopteris richardii]|nr:hypothetical protein KP509_02G085600 [Ceratopteris richardii]
MCLRCLALKDPSSQELLETVEQEQVWSYVENGNQVQEAHDLEGLNALEERIMQHLAHQLARRGILRSGTAANAQRTGQPIGDENLPIYRRRGGVILHNQSSSQRHPHLADRYHSELEPLQEDQARSSDIAESLKSCILIASAKCKETFARTTRTFKERFQGRINKASDVAESANELSTMARHVLRRVSPTSDGNEDLPST